MQNSLTVAGLSTAGSFPVTELSFHWTLPCMLSTMPGFCDKFPKTGWSTVFHLTKEFIILPTLEDTVLLFSDVFALHGEASKRRSGQQRDGLPHSFINCQFFSYLLAYLLFYIFLFVKWWLKPWGRCLIYTVWNQIQRTSDVKMQIVYKSLSILFSVCEVLRNKLLCVLVCIITCQLTVNLL